ALLDFEGMADLNAWLSANASNAASDHPPGRWSLLGPLLLAFAGMADRNAALQAGRAHGSALPA
ncbi:MAG: hypothetical protein ACK5UG_12200, partial [Synechococcaceae cyanobacterium]